MALRATTFAAAYWLSCLFETDQADRMSLMYGLGMDDNGAEVVLPSIHRTEAALLRLQGRRDAYDSKAATDTSPRREVSLLQQQSILRLAESKELLAESYPSPVG